VILSQSEMLTVDESWLQSAANRSGVPTGPLASTLAQQEKKMIEAALADSCGRISGPSGAAVKLGIPRQTLDSKIASLQISKNQFRTQPAT
jgi:formate hydrogenlyase transcriptional activator